MLSDFDGVKSRVPEEVGINDSVGVCCFDKLCDFVLVNEPDSLLLLDIVATKVVDIELRRDNDAVLEGDVVIDCEGKNVAEGVETRVGESVLGHDRDAEFSSEFEIDNEPLREAFQCVNVIGNELLLLLLMFNADTV